MRSQSRLTRSSFCALAACLIGAALGDELTFSDDVITLTDATVNKTLNQPGTSVLLEIFAPWCGHCRSLAPEYAAASRELADSALPVVLAQIDGTESTKTAEWLGIKGYPTLLWFSNGTRDQYNGARTREAIVLWVKKRVGPPAETLESLEALKKIQSEVFLLGYFQELQGFEYAAFQTAAAQVSEWPVYQTQSQAVAEAVNLSRAPGFAVGTNFSVMKEGFKAVPWIGHEAFDNTLDLIEQIEAFLRAEQLPPYIPYSSSTNARVFALKFQIFLVGPIEQLQPGGAALTAVREAHSRHKGLIAFSTAAWRTDPADMLIDFFGLERKDVAEKVQVVGFQAEDKKYLLLEPLTKDSLLEFCKRMTRGTYQRLYKSAPVPKEDPKPGQVAVVVGKTFDQIVLDPSKDVLLMVYTTWSERSKHLAVVWKKVARHVRHAQSVVVAKFEGGANEHAKVPGTAYPSIWLFPAMADTDGLKFSGEPSSKELLRFLKRHAATPFDVKPPKIEDRPDEL